MRAYHRTFYATEILREGFRDATDTYMTSREHTGVWVSDRPLDENEGAGGNVLLVIDISEEIFANYEWIEDGKTYREALVPAAILNALKRPEIVDEVEHVLDLADICIDAHATKIDIEISEHKGDIIITIDDDGTGMDEETLSEALRLGSDTERESTDLGKFGTGSVTASIGLSQRVEVLTKEIDGPLFYGGFDLEQIAAENRFIKWIDQTTKEQTESFGRPKGTRVRLSKTDRISSRNATTFANTLRSRIGQVFRKFLKSGVTITVNGKSVEPIDGQTQ